MSALTTKQVCVAVFALSDMVEQANRSTSQINGYDLLLNDWARAFIPLIDHCVEELAA